MFHTRVPDKDLTQKIEDMHRTCKVCVTSKRNRPSDRGLLGVLPLPHMVNALLYVDFGMQRSRAWCGTPPILGVVNMVGTRNFTCYMGAL